MNKSFKRTVVLLALLLALSAGAFGAPKNVILLIGDGMGIAHISAARISTGGPDGRLAMDGMPVTGFVTTYSANALITDSAASATAIATGVKTNNGMIGQSPDGRRAKSILEAARGIGKSTGIVTTTAVTDATPASFAAHVDARSKQVEIAGQMLAARVDVIMGGGRGMFLPNSVDGGNRADNRNLLSEAAARGYAVATTKDELESAKSTRILGLFAMGNLTTDSPEPPLSMLAQRAIDTLSDNRKGFFLMVEGGLIDIQAHHNDFDGMIRQLSEFDRAVAAALDFARRDGNTLVIVTADHETGGLTLLTDETGGLKPMWTTKGHSAIVVPIYAFGPDAGRFSGVQDNTRIGKTIAELWQVDVGNREQ